MLVIQGFLIILIFITTSLNISTPKLFAANLKLINFLSFTWCCLLISYISGFNFFIHFLLSIIIIGALLFGISLPRIYIYIVSLIFIGLSSFFLTLKTYEVAEFLAVIGFSLLVLGFIKDVIYKTIFKS